MIQTPVLTPEQKAQVLGDPIPAPVLTKSQVALIRIALEEYAATRLLMLERRSSSEPRVHRGQALAAQTLRALFGAAQTVTLS